MTTVADLVLSLADNKQLLGMRYAEWSSATPTLEADIAAAAMGLDDLGHARVLYGCLTELDGDPRGPERDSDPASWRNVAFLDGSWTRWDQFVAANAILDSAFTLVIEALVEGDVEILRTRLRKMLSEERFHHLHGKSWLKEGVDEAVVKEAERQAAVFLGPDDEVLPGTKLRAGQLRERLGVPQPRVDWKSWNPLRRRTEPGQIDARTFDMLTGLLEKRYNLASSRES